MKLHANLISAYWNCLSLWNLSLGLIMTRHKNILEREKARAAAKERRAQEAADRAEKRARAKMERDARQTQSQLQAAAAANGNYSHTGRNSGINEFRRQITELRERLTSSEEKFDAQQLVLHKEILEKADALKQVSALNEMIESMRQALSIQMEGGHHDCHCDAMVANIQPNSYRSTTELTHTPHFLQKADNKAPMRNDVLAKKGGYKSSGLY